MSRQHCENYDVKRETVHCYQRNVDHCCWNLSKFFKFCFVLVCHLTNHLSLVSWETANFVSLESQCFSFSGNKIYCSPRDQSVLTTQVSQLSREKKKTLMPITKLIECQRHFRDWSKLKATSMSTNNQLININF